MKSENMLDMLDDDTLDMVCGGDKGDAKKDNNGMSSMYNIGQHVEVYNTRLHITTTNCEIVDKYFNKESRTWKYCFITTIKSCENGANGLPCRIDTETRKIWIDADNIEK